MRNPRPSPSDPPLFAAGQFMLIWVGFLFMEIIVHTIAGTTAIWYFHRNDDSYDYPSSPAFTALKWSLSSAFGSLAMASFILTVVRIIVMMVRAMEENMREEGGAAAFLACILRCIIETIEAWIQFITKMSTITVAITNDEFWSSCKRTMGMFYRCYLEGIMVERFAKITMSFLAAAVSLIMFVLSCKACQGCLSRVVGTALTVACGFRHDHECGFAGRDDWRRHADSHPPGAPHWHHCLLHPPTSGAFSRGADPCIKSADVCASSRRVVCWSSSTAST